MIQGTLDLLILKTISMGPRHGWAIAKRSCSASQRLSGNSKRNYSYT
jgi:hypothetical protein